MFKPWISIPATAVAVTLPMRSDGEYNIMFRDVETIDDVLEQLTELRMLMAEKEKVTQ